MTIEIFKKLIEYKLKAYKKIVLPDSFVIDIFFDWSEKYLKRKAVALYDELSEEFPDMRFVDCESLLSYGLPDFIIFVTSSIFWTIFVTMFPFIISDFLYDVSMFLLENPVVFCLLIPLCSAVILLFIPSYFKREFKKFASIASLVSFISSLVLLSRLDLSSEEFQMQYKLDWETYTHYDVEHSYINLILGVDGLSAILILLTSFIFVIIFGLNWNSVFLFEKEAYVLYFLLEFFIFFAFSSLDLILFFIFFEATLLPLFLIIGIYGSRERKVYAAYKLFFFTLVGSVLMIIGIAAVILSYSSGDFCYLVDVTFDPFWQKFIWLSFFISFIVKLPSIPVHIWLPEAHVEAPTGGSIVLASILLKLGGYGFFRFLIPLFPLATAYFAPLILFLGVISIIYASIVAIRQIDIKKIIAYSSIAHMGFVMLAFASLTEFAMQGAIFIMISHGIISAALFASVGVLYDRYKTKLVVYYKSLLTTMPVFSICFFLASLANISLPLTSGFIGEFFVLFGLFQFNIISTIIACLSIILSVVYSLWLFNRVFFGQISTKYIKFYQDMDLNETICILTLLIMIFIFGIMPWLLFEQFEFVIRFLNWVALIKIR